jgi:hypothetical protein
MKRSTHSSPKTIAPMNMSQIVANRSADKGSGWEEQ